MGKAKSSEGEVVGLEGENREETVRERLKKEVIGLPWLATASGWLSEVDMGVGEKGMG